MHKLNNSIHKTLAKGHYSIRLGFVSLILALVPLQSSAQTELISQRATSDFPDVESSTWAAEAIHSLNERYGCLEGFPDGTFQGETALTRYQFAAGLYACLSNYDAEIQGRIDQLVTKADLAILFRVLSTLFETASPELEGENPLLPDGSLSPDFRQQSPDGIRQQSPSGPPPTSAPEPLQNQPDTINEPSGNFEEQLQLMPDDGSNTILDRRVAEELPRNR